MNIYANTICFFITWLLSMIIWAFVLDGLAVVVAGFISGLSVLGAVNIIISR